MATISNKLVPADVVDRLNDLAQDRAAWENGSFKQSNTELYVLLDRCFTLLEQMKGQRKLIKELNALLDTKKLKWNKGTSLATKIARCVFGADTHRVTGYARVLRVAEAEKAANVSFITFVNRKGGVEEVRKQKVAGVLTKAEQTKQDIEFAEGHFVKSASLVSGIVCKAATVQPNAENGLQYSAALLRKNKDGTFSIVFGCNKEAVVNTLLAEGGKIAAKQGAQVSTAKTRTVARKARAANIKAVTANVRSRQRKLKIAA